ncbi:MAG: winged helix-turn-helix domain-containing protein [Beijerinckiaceae bacterium]
MSSNVKHLNFFVVGQTRLPVDIVSDLLASSVSLTRLAGAADPEQEFSRTNSDFVVADLGPADHARLKLLTRWARVCPVVIVSASATPAQRAFALENGVEDVVSPAAADREIALRIERALGRWRRKRQNEDILIRFKDFELDPGARVLRRHGQGAVPLSASEGSLLRLLLAKPDRPASRQEITRRCLKTPFHERSRAPDMLASKLRAKLRQLGEAQALETLRGEGYRLRLDQPRA